MTRYSTMGRVPISSLDDDQFYSAPSSRIASRHASLIASHNLQETGHGAISVQSPNSTHQSGCSTPGSPLEPHTPGSKQISRPRVATPFAIDCHHNPRRHHFCPKSISRCFHRTFHATSERIPLLQPLTNDSSVDTNGYRRPLVSSPGSPTGTDCWSPAYAGAQTPCSELDGAMLDGPIAVNRQAADTIVRNIRAYLSNRGHTGCSTRTERSSINENLPPLSELWAGQNGFGIDHPKVSESRAESYLVTTDDIAGILDIVIAGICRVRNDSSAVECLSMLLPKEPLAKPKPNMDFIVPGSPSIADPATTISYVQPSFSIANCSDYHGHCVDTARTTFISRQSITEVT
ncbi:hypothetical protein F5Y00DRAFT_149532 [Daldinia vernicosa]|uniref:uncharacterized protein n=1 Tax=Daldinia vernicosa TaxID=114800 RepID=UPI0020086895|nr:uncharacterized protein F5Y00DRAFT_149532 [Daldinia vernicosa]KAI0846132.1 hypothetical protein F5Y00DRAFT_149532 [Daldinia vernicosa]